MNSRERVLLAINHQEADRAPIDVGATRQSGIAASVYHLLKRRLGLSTPTRVYDVYQMLAEIEQPILERFGADCVGLNRPSVAFGIRNEGWKPWTLQDGTPVEVPGGFDPRTDHLGNLVLYDACGAAIAKMPKGGFYFDRLEISRRRARRSGRLEDSASVGGRMRPFPHPGRRGLAEHRQGDYRRDGPPYERSDWAPATFPVG